VIVFKALLLDLVFTGSVGDAGTEVKENLGPIEAARV
jgi:hypothetical protein